MGMKKYKFISANEYCVRVFDGTHDSPKPCEKGYKLLTSKNILAGELDKTSAYYISENDYNAINQRSKVQQYDILFSMIGSVGNVCFVKDSNIDFAIKNMGVFSCENKEKALYLYYYLQSPFAKKMIDSYLNGAVQKFLGLERLRNFPILEYSTDKQKIAAILSSLDDKITLNKKINAKLEAMAKRLYDYWFVQFDFPNEEGKPYKSSGGKMVWNEVLKRKIPEGWEVKRLGDLFLNKISATEPGEHLKNLEYCPIDEIPMRRMSFAGGKSYNEANSSLQLYGMKDILIGAMRVYFHRCCIAAKAGITRTTTIVLTPHNKTHLSYLYQVCNEDKTFDFAIKVSNGTQQPYVTWKALSDYYFVYPNDETIIDVFCDKTNSVIEMVLKNEKEIQKLTSMRYRLLPLLMNGQVEVE